MPVQTSHISCRLLLREDTADQAVSQEDVGGLLRRPGADSDLVLVPGRVHVALQVDDLPTHGELMAHGPTFIPGASASYEDTAAHRLICLF